MREEGTEGAERRTGGKTQGEDDRGRKQETRERGAEARPAQRRCRAELRAGGSPTPAPLSRRESERHEENTVDDEEESVTAAVAILSPPR